MTEFNQIIIFPPLQKPVAHPYKFTGKPTFSGLFMPISLMIITSDRIIVNKGW